MIFIIQAGLKSWNKYFTVKDMINYYVLVLNYENLTFIMN